MSRRYWLSEDRHGPLKVYAKPRSGGEYVLGVDVCEGRGTVGDNACIQVVQRDSWEQVAVWCDRVDPDETASTLLALAHWYEDGFIVLETQGGGNEVGRVLKKAEYFHRWRRKEWDRMGNEYQTKWDWHTNAKTRPLLVSGMRRAVRTKRIVVHDPETLEEMMGWSRLESARGGLKEGPSDSDGHDDRVIALGLAIQGLQLDEDWEDGDDVVDTSLPPSKRRKGVWLKKREAQQRFLGIGDNEHDDWSD